MLISIFNLPDQAHTRITKSAKTSDSKKVVPLTGFFNLNFSRIIQNMKKNVFTFEADLNVQRCVANRD